MTIPDEGKMMLTNNALKNTTLSVSYTHLDVYKRQPAVVGNECHKII